MCSLKSTLCLCTSALQHSSKCPKGKKRRLAPGVQSSSEVTHARQSQGAPSSTRPTLTPPTVSTESSESSDLFSAHPSNGFSNGHSMPGGIALSDYATMGHGVEPIEIGVESPFSSSDEHSPSSSAAYSRNHLHIPQQTSVDSDAESSMSGSPMSNCPGSLPLGGGLFSDDFVSTLMDQLRTELAARFQSHFCHRISAVRRRMSEIRQHMQPQNGHQHPSGLGPSLLSPAGLGRLSEGVASSVRSSQPMAGSASVC